MDSTNPIGGEIRFDKYVTRGSCHWQEEFGSFWRFNLVQHSRYLSVLAQLPAHCDVMLDWGCGDGALSAHLVNRCEHFIGVDVETEGLEFFRHNNRTVLNKCELVMPENYYHTTLSDASVDCIVCSDVIEHVAKPEVLLAEFFRLLKPGGKLVLTTPYRLQEQPMDKNHVMEFFPSQLEQVVLQGGFVEIQMTLYQKVLWFSLYSLSLHYRPVFRWMFNILYRVTGWNPFMQTDADKRRFDIFGLIVLSACKPSV